MDYSEALRIIDPKTARFCINEYEQKGYRGFCGISAWVAAYDDAHEIAADCIREVMLREDDGK